VTERSAAAEALTDLILEVFRLNGRLLAAGDALTRPFGQTSARWQVLGAIADEPRTVASIARDMGLARQSVQRTADLLERDGIVEFAANPAHRRAKLVRLSRRGRRILERITHAQVGWANDLVAVAALDERVIRKALETAARIRTALEDEHSR
jgi:DNA-binding MarR family transcriptional regulator